MASEAPRSGATRVLFRVGWWALVVFTSLFILNHLLGVFTFATSDDERVMFLAFAALEVLSLIVLLIPYRALQQWAWWASWVQIVVTAVPVVVFGADPISLGYSVIAVAMAAAQFASLPAFRGARQKAHSL